MYRMVRLFLLLLTCGPVLGCGHQAPPLAPTRPPEVLISQPVNREITDYEVFTGRTEAIPTVEIRARVSGYLDKTFFKEGTEVKEGDLLFKIDPRTYQAEVDRAAAALVQSEAHSKRLETDYRRAANLLNRNAIGQEEYDKIAGDRAEADAAVKSAQAVLASAKLNLGFTDVKAPISGRISRWNVDPGNLVKADDTALTTIVNQDPIYAYFDVDERTLLKFRRLIQEGKIESARKRVVQIALALADEDDFPHQGTIDFIDNKVDPTTGTLRVRGKFPNPTKTLLSAGLFVRIRLPIGLPHEALLISERALGTDQGQKFVYVINDKNEVVYRRIKVGSLNGGLRVVEDGLAPGEKVIVSGLQRVRPGVQVQPKPADLPAQPARSV